MKKKPTLDETWIFCPQMWKWIAGQIRKDPEKNVDELKEEWVTKHGWDDEELAENCFFCDWALRKHQKNKHKTGVYYRVCNYCPARKIDKEFNCGDTEYDHYHYPLEFYQKIVELNKIRQGRRKSTARKPDARNLQK